MATGLAAAINADSHLAAVGVGATSSGAVITVANDTSYTASTSGGATETVSVGTSYRGNVQVTIGGKPTTGDTVTVSAHNPSLSGGVENVTYTVLSTDTLQSISAALAAAINADANLKALGISTNNAMQFATTELFNGNGILPNGVSSASITAVDGSSNVKTNGLQVSTSGASATSLTYDLNGNLLNDGTNSYAWDAENRMIKITYPGTGNYSTFSYDGLGRNAGIVETVSGSVTSSTKQFVFVRGARCEARNGAASVIAQRFSLGEAISGTPYNYTFDALGSVRELIDGSGNIKAQYGYDPFGREIRISEVVPSDFGYAGYYVHQASTLDLTVQRAYNPSFGRFISRDPIEEAGGNNLFAYVDNNPESNSDPIGTGFLEGGGSGSIGARIGGDPISPNPVGAKCLNECKGKLPLIGPLLILSGLPILSTATKIGGTTVGTSPASAGLRALIGDLGADFGPFYGPTATNPFSTTPNLGGALGRWVPLVGAAMTAAEYANFLNCLQNCIKNAPKSCGAVTK